MMITRESDYAIRIIRALKDGELLPLEQICQRELVPKQFAYKILKKLERSGLVSIRRGAGGGCLLNRSLADLTLLDIIKAADEEFFLNPCLDSQYQCGYAASFDGCKVHCELARVQRVLEEELKRTSLDRLFNKSG